MAELERAKIIERVTRAKQLRLAQGCLLGCGANIYGYDYRRRTPASPPALTVNEEEAAVVREIFATYAKGQVGMNQITRSLEDRGVPTKGGHKLWRTSLLKHMLRNETYCGVKYFNTRRRVREYANPLHGTRPSSSKCIKRPRNEWVGVKVPAIVSQALFDEVQERFAWNQQHYRNPQRVQLLSSLIRCGSCGGSFFGYRRYFTKDLKHAPGHVYHKAAYTCNWRHRAQMHSKKSSVERCHNKEVKAELLDARVCAMIEEIMLDPEKLKGCKDFFKGTTRAAHLKLTQDLRVIDRRMEDVDEAKHRIIDVYASGDLERDAYVERSLDYDQELNALRRQRAELVKKIPLLHKGEAVDVSITQYCSAADVRFRSCVDFSSKRQFLLDHIDKVVFSNDRVELHGSVPVRVSANEAAADEGDDSKIDFCIEDRITRSDWLAFRRASMAEAPTEVTQQFS